MAQSIKRRGAIGKVCGTLRGGIGAHDDLNEELTDPTPWITVRNGSFNREILKDSFVAGVVISALTILFTELLLRSGLFRFESTLQTSDLLTALSVVAILAVGYAGYRNGKRTAKRAHTVALLSEAMSNDGLFNSMMAIRSMGSERIEKFVDAEKFDLMTELDIIRTLNFYEFVAIACNSGDVDANVVLKVRGEAMSATAEKFAPVIERVRAEYSPETYKAFTNLVHTYDKRKRAWESAQTTPTPA